MEATLKQLKTSHKDLPKVEGKPQASGPMVLDVAIQPDGKMYAQFRDPVTNQVFGWGLIEHPENFCNVVDAFRGQRG